MDSSGLLSGNFFCKFLPSQLHLYVITSSLIVCSITSFYTSNILCTIWLTKLCKVTFFPLLPIRVCYDMMDKCLQMTQAANISSSLDVVLRRKDTKEGCAPSLFSAKSFKGRPEVKLLNSSTSIFSKFFKFWRKLITPPSHSLLRASETCFVQFAVDNFLDRANVKLQIILLSWLLYDEHFLFY